ncbi:hypothetical protein SAMN05880501_106251 [Ureibacillus xyleni]|uniref:Uncharacterized protein n=1 Tax=Ureibacillus xyleni TaxID=614648 RepID=A0A285SYE4_9BACL|nr:hypothetical protein [Ureibacillus xyleni]SOC11708.1 hypothetical protein SAMN05880501_106251 [Ureibacillus xyleni]
MDGSVSKGASMELKKETELAIHTYVILELAIKSIEHDKKLFDSFQFKRSYLPLMDQFLESLTEEFKQTSKRLYKEGIKKETYQRINNEKCLYTFLYRGEVIPFVYQSVDLKNQVERKIETFLKKS